MVMINTFRNNIIISVVRTLLNIIEGRYTQITRILSTAQRTLEKVFNNMLNHAQTYLEIRIVYVIDDGIIDSVI